MRATTTSRSPKPRLIRNSQRRRKKAWVAHLKNEGDGLERWQSGRLHLTRNQENLHGFREFESPPFLDHKESGACAGFFFMRVCAENTPVIAARFLRQAHRP